MIAICRLLYRAGGCDIDRKRRGLRSEGSESGSASLLTFFLSDPTDLVAGPARGGEGDEGVAIRQFHFETINKDSNKTANPPKNSVELAPVETRGAKHGKR